MTPYRLKPGDDTAPVLALIQASFAYMEGRIDPPSSMQALTHDSLAAQILKYEIWAMGTPPIACMVLSRKGDALYLGKLAVDRAHRGKGLARGMVALALQRAKDLHLPALELQTRVELVENQAAFRAMGFHETARTAHAGYDRPTSITFRKNVV